MVKKQYYLFLFIIGITLLIQGSPIAQETAVPVTLEGPDELIVGSSFTVSLTVTQLSSFDAANFDIHFKNTLVTVDTVLDGTINGTTVPVSMWGLIDDNTIRIVINMPGVTGITGNGTLALINFTTIQAGNLLINASDTVFSNITSEEIPTTWSSYTATITTDVDDAPTETDGGNSNGGSGGTANPPDGPNQLPIALCLSDVTTATIGQQILFNGTASFDNDGNIISYDWDFGDNTTSNLSSITHSYAQEGEYQVALTVTDDDNARTTCQTNVTIQGTRGELLPAIIAGPITCIVDTLCSYTITTPGLIDQMVSYQITWNDTQIHTQTTEPMDSDAPYIFNITWTTAGIYSLSVISSSNDGTTDATTVRILVDSISLAGIGYIIDSDTDGIYDTFQDLFSSQRNALSYENNQYRIDSDFDDQWDYIYNQSSGLKQIADQPSQDTVGFEFFLILLGVFFIVFITKKH